MSELKLKTARRWRSFFALLVVFSLLDWLVAWGMNTKVPLNSWEMNPFVRHLGIAPLLLFKSSTLLLLYVLLRKWRPE